MLGSRQLEINKYKIRDDNLCVVYLVSSYQYSINIFLSFLLPVKHPFPCSRVL